MSISDDYSISFFQPVPIENDSFKKQLWALGRYGEWFFNFKRTVFEVRADALKSKLGTEVIEKTDHQESKYWNVTRVIL